MYYTGKLPNPLSQEELCAYIEQYKETGNLEARNIAVEHNIRLVVQVIQKYRKHIPYEKEDLISISLIRLLEQLNQFDSTRDVKFSTWARPVILNNIRNYMSKNNRYMNMERLDQVSNLALDQNEEPVLYTMEDVTQSERQYYKYKSKDEDELSDDSVMEYGLTLADTLPNVTNHFVADYEEKEIDSITTTIFYDLLQELSEQERQAVILRFGFYGHAPHTYSEVGNALNISHVWARILINKVLQEVKRRLKKYYGIETPNQKRK